MDSPTADKLDALGINYYTKFGTKAMLAEGWMLGQVYWADEVIGLDWLKNKIQTNTFNAFAELKRSRCPMRVSPPSRATSMR